MNASAASGQVLPFAGCDLGGQVALVTGATSGLGYRFAKVLASAGALVAVAGRREDRLLALADEIDASGGKAVVCPLDVRDADALAQVVTDVGSAFAPISILINNAGVPDGQLATKMSVDLIDQLLAINVRAPFILAREVARPLIKLGKPGRIVNIGSMAAFHQADKGASLYSTTKAAISRMTETLAVEWADTGINVNCIAPGSFDSEMMDGMRRRIGSDFITAFPRKRLGDPAQLDSTLLYLVSPASEAVTGVTIKVDDGQLPR